jgi:tetratricopeptide (TPR) repeat protein
VFFRDPIFFDSGFRHRLHFDDAILLNSLCRARDFFFFVNLGPYAERNVPVYVHDVQQRYESTPVDVAESDDPAARAYSAFAREDFSGSIAAFTEAIEANPDDGLLRLARAQAHIAAGDYDAAGADIDEGMRMIPDWPAVQINMADLYSDPDSFAGHLKRLKGWVKKHPKDATARFVLGYVHYFLQEYDRAKSEFVHVLSLEPDHTQATLLLKAVYEREAQAAEKE